MQKPDVLNFILAIAVVLLSARLFTVDGRRGRPQDASDRTPAVQQPWAMEGHRLDPRMDFHGAKPEERRGVSDMALAALGLDSGILITNRPPAP